MAPTEKQKKTKKDTHGKTSPSLSNKTKYKAYNYQFLNNLHF